MHMLIMTVIPLDIHWGASPAKIASAPGFLRRELDGIQNPVLIVMSSPLKSTSNLLTLI